MRRRILAIVPLAPFLAGCPFSPRPYTVAASTYGDDTSSSAAALSAVPSVLTKTCWKAANAEYLQERLIRIKAEADGTELPEGGDYYVSFVDWRDEAPASAAPTMTWGQYCTELGKTGAAFRDGVSALTTYAEALQDLAKPPGGTFGGADLKTATDNVGRVLDAVKLSTTASSKAIRPISDALKLLGTAIVAQITEDKLRGYVTDADPKVGALIDALLGYVEAVDGEFTALESREKTAIGTLELLVGLGTVRDTLPGCALAGAAPHAHDHQGKAIAEVCDTLESMARRLSTTAALAFYQYALATLEDVRQTRAALAGFEDVLGELKTAHAELRKSGAGNPPDFKTLFGMLSDLVTKLQSLQAALSGK